LETILHDTHMTRCLIIEIGCAKLRPAVSLTKLNEQ